MLNALEEDPDEKHRWRRFGIGAACAVGVSAALLYSAQNFAPTRELLSRVVQMTIQAPPPEQDIPLPPLPPPPPAKKQPKAEKDSTEKKAAAPKPNANPQNADPSQVGMDAESFAAGGDGPGFHVGGNQMGDPNAFVAPVAKPAPPPEVKRTVRPVNYSMAKRIPRNEDLNSIFNARARKLGLSGLMILELELDAKGHVKRARTRRGLEPQFDREVLEHVKKWEYEPPSTTMAGSAVANVRLVRVRFTLEK
jgi:TonB family protein